MCTNLVKNRKVFHRLMIGLVVLTISVFFSEILMTAEKEDEFTIRLETDWMYQDYGMKTSDCFSSGNNAKIEESMVRRVISCLKDSGETSLAAEYEKQLTKLCADKVPGNAPDWRKLYLSACKTRRKIRLTEAFELCPNLVYTTHYVMGGSHYTYTEDVVDADVLDMSSDRKPGAALWKLSLDKNGNVSRQLLLETKTGVIRDPDVSQDGLRILFSMRNNLNEDEFHIYEYDLKTNKSRQLTFGNGFGDIEPVYLPDGNIMFVSSRCMQISSCNPTECSNMYIMDGDGRFLRRIGYDQVDTNYPKVLDDGRVIYTRWEYNDRSQVFPQPLFVMNPDGTGQTEYYGNNSWWPTSILHARGIPGTHKILAIAAGHHTHQRGKLIVLDRTNGNQENEGARYAAPMRDAQRIRVDSANQDGEQFAYPFPVGEHECYVSYLPEESPFLWSNTKYPVTFGLYYFDLDGNRELLAWDSKISSMQPVALQSRDNAVVRPSNVDYNKKTGRFYVQDVYEGPGLTGIPRGTIKKIRIVSPSFARNYIAGENSNYGPGGFGRVPTPASIFNGTWDVKVVLGDVPVEEDGSAFFEVPALTPVYFQLLDANGDMVQTMRSWSTLQPGENFYCIGCHEPKNNAPGNVGTQVNTRTIAMTRAPAVPKLPFELSSAASDYKIPGFSFLRDVQPVLDRYCVECHTGGTNEDGTAKPASLLANEYIEPEGQYKLNKKYNVMSRSLNDSLRQFTEGYVWLTDRGNCNELVTWLHAQDGPEMIKPYTTGAAKSKLIQMFRKKDANHQNVAIDQKSLQKLALWIDLGIPFVGSYTEANNWLESQKALWFYYGMKKDEMAKIIQENIKTMLEFEAGRIPKPAIESIPWFFKGGNEAKNAFIKEYMNRKKPVLNQRKGNDNIYRNLAVNKDDVQGDAQNYPHASTNSEYAWQRNCSAKNVVDGHFRNGKNNSLSVWRPNKRTDLWLDIEFGHYVEIDKMVIQLQLDEKNQRGWNQVTLVFNDDDQETFQLETTEEPQTIKFKARVTNKVRLLNWRQKMPLVDAAVTEVEFWGTSCYDPKKLSRFDPKYSLAYNPDPAHQKYPRASASVSDPYYNNPFTAINGEIKYTKELSDRWYGLRKPNTPNRSEWFEVDFGKEVKFSEITACFFGVGEFQPPESFDVQYWNGSKWLPVAVRERKPQLPVGNKPNRVTFETILSSRVRLVIPHLKDNTKLSTIVLSELIVRP